ncbi:succinate dehydrogenase assembly factor 2 [Caulobacter sp. S45]|jgi:antitoxin CptB|uniref:FAD assembly factor SdhE n=1 Tax=Caulobacter sp. S45 TaxID=1641861 RepID=UPI00131A74AD|nr:succinate dehydrogenase assembly factor 2 [Caulobacter sp. S45]
MPNEDTTVPDPAAPDQAAHEAHLRKVCFRASHRGFLEADLILGPFAREYVGAMSPADLAEFERLLDEPDQDLYGWIVGIKPTPEAFDTPMLARIQEFRFQAHAARTRVE